VRLLAFPLVLLLVAGCLEATDDGPSDPGVDPGASAAAALRFREPVDLGSAQHVAGVGAFGTRCNPDGLQDGDCGLGEPTMEVDSRGHIYVSAVCCLTVPPPVYVSRDGGATFQELATPTGVRETFGIEGDFAVDDVGRVYFADIEFAATFQVTVWDADGTYVRHTKWPAPPLVDRDWIRAEGDGIVYYVYNTGSATNVYKSTDAAATWTPTALFQAPFGLGNAVSGLADGELWILGGNGDGGRLAEVTTDGGTTWRQEQTTIAGGSFPVGGFDEGGRLYGAGTSNDTVLVSVRAPDGNWGPRASVSGVGHHRMPWLGAGADRGAVVAWYGTNETETDGGTEWFLHVALTLDAGATWATRIADPTPVFTGESLQDQLLDFFQVEVGPDGTIHVAYSSMPIGEEPEARLHYVRTEPIAALAPTTYFNGP
jgi:hypothetical protein